MGKKKGKGIENDVSSMMGGGMRNEGVTSIKVLRGRIHLCLDIQHERKKKKRKQAENQDRNP